MEQNLLVPLNWLAGAKLLQYSHLSTGNARKTEKIEMEEYIFNYKEYRICIIISNLRLTFCSYNTL